MHISRRKSELKLEHSGTHATFFNLDTKIEDGIFVYKLFHKRDKVPFFIPCMPHFENNIPSTIFYASRLTLLDLRLLCFLDMYTRYTQ